jgi:cytoskeleton protein RodZ
MDSDDPQQPAFGESAGQQLKRAREQHGLSLKDVADAQHLRVKIIQAIESGQYDQIDSELFLKGYVRAYAKQVGADADALIASLDLELEPLRREQAKEEQENPLADLERRRRKKRRLAKALLWLLVLGAITATAWTLVIEPRLGANSPVDEVLDSDEPPAPVDSTDMSAGEELEPEPEPEPEQMIAPEPSAESLPDTDTETSVDALAGNESGQQPLPETVPEPANPEPVDPEPVETVNVAPVIEPDPVFEESAQPESVAVSTELEMSFVSDCWVQITDASGVKLVASLQRDGDQVSVSGRAPFSVVIGAVDAVGSVSFDGEPVDLSNFRVVNNRTDFTLTL